MLQVLFCATATEKIVVCACVCVRELAQLADLYRLKVWICSPPGRVHTVPLHLDCLDACQLELFEGKRKGLL